MIQDPDEARRSEASRAAILEFLRSRAGHACFSTEVAAGAGDRRLRLEEVEAHLRELHAEGRVWLEEFVPPDPHLPPRILIASGIDPSLPVTPAREAARARVQGAFEAWLREFMLTHRCV
jgi:hypothetical protein